MRIEVNTDVLETESRRLLGLAGLLSGLAGLVGGIGGKLDWDSGAATAFVRRIGSAGKGIEDAAKGMRRRGEFLHFAETTYERAEQKLIAAAGGEARRRTPGIGIDINLDAIAQALHNMMPAITGALAGGAIAFGKFAAEWITDVPGRLGDVTGAVAKFAKAIEDAAKQAPKTVANVIDDVAQFTGKYGKWVAKATTIAKWASRASWAFVAIGGVITAVEEYNASSASTPIGKISDAVVETAFVVGGSIAGGWIGGAIGGWAGGALGLPTGPGAIPAAVVGTVIGNVVGGAAGGAAGDHAADAKVFDGKSAKQVTRDFVEGVAPNIAKEVGDAVRGGAEGVAGFFEGLTRPLSQNTVATGRAQYAM